MGEGEGIRIKALQRAAEILGGRERLRERLGASASQFAAWIDGREPPPMDAFLVAVDVISAAARPDRST